MLDKTVAEYFGCRSRNADVGIEIECEGKTVSFEPGTSIFWNSVPDGSLREGGIEYVIRQPIKIAKLDEAMGEWSELTKVAEFKPSIRTSVHVHRNVTNFTLRQVYTQYCFFWLVENMLVEANGKDRVGNMFCLRICDAEELFKGVIRGLKTQKFFQGIATDHYRYAALNPSALGKYGTLEWRFIKGLTNSKEIALWVRNLYLASTEISKFKSPQEVVDLFRKEDSETFLDHFFTKDFLAYIFKSVPLWRAKLDEGFPFAYELAKKFAECEEAMTKPKFTLPYITTPHEDLLPDETIPASLKTLKTRSTFASLGLNMGDAVFVDIPDAQ
jgi:hypothetical protein